MRRAAAILLGFLGAACSAPSRPKVAATLPAPVAPAPASTAPALDAVVPDLAAFALTRAMIPMRDGAKLETAIFAPRAATEPLPLLLSRSPYGVPDDESPLVGPDAPQSLVADGYIFVFQNVRGRFKSEGTFVLAGAPRDRVADPTAVDDVTDAYDTIEWLVHNVPNNSGRVGMWGGSYSAWTAAMALVEPHPALRVISEAASPADQFLGDDSHHNGAFRLGYCFEFSAFLESSKGITRFAFDRADTYDWYLALGPLSNADARYFHGRLASWNDLVRHPNYDAFWQNDALTAHLTKTSIPVLNIAGWWDQEDFYGPLQIYQTLERSDSEHRNHLVVGPWNHGGWTERGRKLGSIDFGSDTGVEYRDRIQAPWFARWLHDAPRPEPPEASIFVTGESRWRSFDRWPPVQGVTPAKLYLRAHRKLSFDPPPEPSAYDEYVSDPQNPVPYVRRPIRPTFQGSDWSVWQVMDQRFVDHRPDVLSWETDALDRDLVVAGNVVVELFAATSGTDADWIVKLIDVFPEGASPPPGQAGAGHRPPDLRGYQLMIAGDVMRARFRTSFSHPEPVPAGAFVRYEIGLNTRAHAFLKGHRIMVQVQSSWFPLIDRNPQKYVDNIFLAKESDFIKATQRVGRSRGAPSAVVLPILQR